MLSINILKFSKEKEAINRAKGDEIIIDNYIKKIKLKDNNKILVLFIRGFKGKYLLIFLTILTIL